MAGVGTIPRTSRPAWGDLTGAFADTAVLFPLLLALAWQTGASAVMMLATTGLAYLATGWLFRLPIPVQPLKSLSLMAIASGASAQELQLAGLSLGVIYFSLSFINVNRLAGCVPDVLVHGFQLGLGILLVSAAVRLLGVEPGPLLLVALGSIAVLGLTRLTGFPLLGVIAVAGLVWGIVHARPPEPGGVTDTLRPTIIALMVLPQIALTLTNSVLGTQRAAAAYFGPAAWRVSPRRLLVSLGLGNLVAGLAGGMPYCHGSGGVTAHYRGGSRSLASNVVIGTALLGLAGALYLGGGGLPAFPPALQALLLAVIGVFHMQLTRASWARGDTALILMAMGIAALLAGSMLAVLVTGVVALGLRRLWRLRQPPSQTDTFMKGDRS